MTRAPESSPVGGGTADVLPLVPGQSCEGGTIRLVEHGRSDVTPLARQEWRADAHYAKMGCRLTQDPRKIVSEADLSVQDTETGLFGILTTFEIAPQEV